MQIVIDRIPEVDLSHLPESRRRVDLDTHDTLEDIPTVEPKPRALCQHCPPSRPTILRRENVKRGTCDCCQRIIDRGYWSHPKFVSAHDSEARITDIATEYFGCVSEMEFVLATSQILGRVRMGRPLTRLMTRRINTLIENLCRAQLRRLEGEEG